MATDPSADLQLDSLTSEPRTLGEWVTNFHLLVVVVDPFTYESSWILKEADRILDHYRPADVRVGFLVTGTKDEAKQFLGPLAEEYLTFADPDRAFVKATGLEALPALVHINTAVGLEGAAEGWEPAEWRAVTARLSEIMSWSRPNIPGPTTPVAFGGSPALG